MLLEFIASVIVVPAIVLGACALFFKLGHFISREGLGRVTHGRWTFHVNLWHMLAVAAVAVSMFLAIQGGAAVALAVIIAALAVLIWFIRAWCHEFLFLMDLRDDDLPGRNDKLIWAIVLFAFAPVGPWLFRFYRSAHWPPAVPAAESPTPTQAEPPGTTNPAAQPA
jgi:hypothetical protein